MNSSSQFMTKWILETQTIANISNQRIIVMLISLMEMFFDFYDDQKYSLDKYIEIVYTQYLG